jgi:type VI secretion system protein ImpK
MDRITDVTRDCFDGLIQLRRLDPASLPAPAALHERLRGSVDSLLTRASQAGFAREDVNDIAYAVVALADEIALSRSEEYRDFWAGESLQLQYFKENVAGEAFFTRLESLRRDPRRREILRVYFIALLLGFQGRFKVRGGEVELLRLTEDLQRDLQSGRKYDGEMLSPQGERPDEARAAARGGAILLWGAAITAALVVLLYAGLYFWVGTSARDVVARVAAAKLT